MAPGILFFQGKEFYLSARKGSNTPVLVAGFFITLVNITQRIHNVEDVSAQAAMSHLWKHSFRLHFQKLIHNIIIRRRAISPGSNCLKCLAKYINILVRTVFTGKSIDWCKIDTDLRVAQYFFFLKIINKIPCMISVFRNVHAYGLQHAPSIELVDEQRRSWPQR